MNGVAKSGGAGLEYVNPKGGLAARMPIVDSCVVGADAGANAGPTGTADDIAEESVAARGGRPGKPDARRKIVIARRRDCL